MDWAKEEPKDGANNSAHLCLLLIIPFLSRLCNNFLARSIALKEYYLMMNFEKKIILPFQNIRKNANLMVKPLQNVIFGRSVTQIFFQEICSSGGKQTIHKVSAAFIAKSCHPRTSLICTNSHMYIWSQLFGHKVVD